MTDTTAKTAREYRRLSDKKGGASLARQADNNGSAAAENGWRLGEPYIDDGLSASKYARKRRDDFERLVADMECGDFGADILVLWESSRGSRQVGEWVSFIELCEREGVKIWITTHERLYDPANGRDRKALIDDAVDSEYESFKTHKRIVGTAEFEARSGRPYGAAPYGMRPVYDQRTGDLLTWEEDPERSHIPKQLFALLSVGTPMNEVERQFRRAGYLNLSGRPFIAAHLRDMATRHSYAGLRYHKGSIYQGAWKGIVEESVFWLVQLLIHVPSRHTARHAGAVHVLTAALRCGPCRSLMAVKNNHGRDKYACRNGCLLIDKDPVDRFVTGTREDPGVLMAYLARDDIYELLAAPGQDGKAARDVQATLAREGAELKRMERATAGTLEEAQVLARSIKQKKEEINHLEQRRRELTVPPVVLSLIEPGRDVWDAWERAPLAARRETARIVLSEGYLGQVLVQPSPRTGPKQPIIERLEFRTHQPPEDAAAE